jgi:hypothetical protein
MWGALSDERAGLSFTAAAGPRQRSYSGVRDPRGSWPYFTVPNSRLPQPGGPGLRLYIHQEQGSRVIPPGAGFPFRRLPRLAGLRWRYSYAPPREVPCLRSKPGRFIGSVETDLGLRRGWVVSFALRLFHSPLNTRQITPRTPVRTWWLRDWPLYALPLAHTIWNISCVLAQRYLFL